MTCHKVGIVIYVCIVCDEINFCLLLYAVLYIYMYMYVYIYVYVCIHICIYMYMYVCVCIYIYLCFVKYIFKDIMKNHQLDYITYYVYIGSIFSGINNPNTSRVYVIRSIPTLSNNLNISHTV